MPPTIKAIHLNSFRVNSYLLENDGSYFLIDTGTPGTRLALEKEIVQAGCKEGNLKLILLTHADIDHCGNAAYLREKYGAKIALHHAEASVVEQGPMSLNRGHLNFLARSVLQIARLRKKDRFTPDVYLEDGDDLSSYGLEAKVLHTPGHSEGSISILTSGPEAALFCGDLLTNRGKPALNSLIDDRAEMEASFSRLSKMEIGMVYPGHGSPFPMEALKF